jgi:hypothetical protein
LVWWNEEKLVSSGDDKILKEWQFAVDEADVKLVLKEQRCVIVVLTRAMIPSNPPSKGHPEAREQRLYFPRWPSSRGSRQIR